MRLPWVVVLSESGSFDECGPRSAIEPRARIEPVAEAFGVVEGERDERGRDIVRALAKTRRMGWGSPTGS